MTRGIHSSVERNARASRHAFVITFLLEREDLNGETRTMGRTRFDLGTFSSTVAQTPSINALRPLVQEVLFI